MSVLHETADALVAVDSDGIVAEANAAAVELLGPLEGRDVAGALAPELLSGAPALPGGWPPAVARLPSCRALVEHDLRVNGVRGRREVSVTVRFLRGPDRRLEGAVLSVRDLQTRRRAHQSSADLVSTVSHELRSPLASVKGYTATLLHRWERLSDEDKRFMIEQVNYDADRVTRLINELLDVSRLESGRLVLRPSPVRLPELLASIAEKLHFAHPEARVEIDFGEEFPPVYADRDKVEQVLTNLIENAAKYADSQAIEVEGRVDGEFVSVSVSDRGEGLPADVLPRIFSKFFRAENRAGRPTGTGLGLYIARGIAAAHGGSLDATSELGRGSVFTLSLPIGPP